MFEAKKVKSSKLILSFGLVPFILFIDSGIAKSFPKYEQTISYRQRNEIETNKSFNPEIIVPEAIALVKKHESFRARAYLDTNGLPVIGYGASKIRGRSVKLGDRITKAEADAALEKEMRNIQRRIVKKVKVQLNNYQLGALASLVYNCGFRVLRNSTLLNKISRGDNEFIGLTE
jgi:GH24 family phage-related lysozyme (muramidase)